MIDVNQVKALVECWLEGKEYFLTDVSVSSDNCIVVEIDHADGVWIEDCVQLSRYIEEHFSRDEEDYELEVGSAGLGQPFKILRQWENHIGKEVEITKKDGKKLKGVLQAVNADEAQLMVKTKVVPEGKKRPVLQDVLNTIPMADIKSGKYIF